MQPEERRLLQEVTALAKENNDILRGMQRRGRIASFFRGVYWLLILTVAVSAYVLIKPYVAQVMETYRDAKSGLEQATKTVETVQKAVGTE